MTKRFSIYWAVALLAAGAIVLLWWLQPKSMEMVLYKKPTCVCCLQWIASLPKSFKVVIKPIDDVALHQEQLGIPPELGACHTAVVDGYIIEGHVPAEDITRLLKERPKIKGLFVPGMPTGAPGMEGPGGKPYSVLTLDSQGQTTVYATHQPREFAVQAK